MKSERKSSKWNSTDIVMNVKVSRTFLLWMIWSMKLKQRNQSQCLGFIRNSLYIFSMQFMSFHTKSKLTLRKSCTIALETKCDVLWWKC
jgi:hypothetical protein